MTAPGPLTPHFGVLYLPELPDCIFETPPPSNDDPICINPAHTHVIQIVSFSAGFDFPVAALAVTPQEWESARSWYDILRTDGYAFTADFTLELPMPDTPDPDENPQVTASAEEHRATAKAERAAFESRAVSDGDDVTVKDHSPSEG